SFDEGNTWRELTANLHSLTNDPFTPTIEIYSLSPSTSEDVLLVGMLGGVFQMAHPDSAGAGWTLLGNGLPHTVGFDIHYDYADNVLLAGTEGRGAWTLSNPFASDSQPGPSISTGSPAFAMASSLPIPEAARLRAPSGSPLKSMESSSAELKAASV